MADEKKIWTGPHWLPVLPIRDKVVFPNIVTSVFIGRQISIAALRNSNEEILLITQKDEELELPTSLDLFMVGVKCRIIQAMQLSDQGYLISVEALERIRVEEWSELNGYIEARYTEIKSVQPELQKPIEQLQGLVNGLIKSFQEYTLIYPKYTSELMEALNRTRDNSKIINLIASNLPIKLAQKQLILEEESIEKQLNMLLENIESQKCIAEIEQKILSHMRKRVEQTQKEVLREQVNAILTEEADEIPLLERKIAELDLPPEARSKAESELKRLKTMSAMTSEASVIRGYLDCILELPWNKYAKLNTNLDEVETVLSENHYGLEKVKERIYEFIAIQTRVQKVKGPVLCLFGPPGVGKTSLAKSIAKATGRPFIRIALGGLKDEAEIRGHRRTYISAMPGKIIQAMRKIKHGNPVILLDEIGNIAKDWRGDPEAALLELLDPEQNYDFKDHYLEIGYDLSSAIFIATTNQLNLQPALRDRLEVISISGYTPIEKFHIAKEHLVRKQLELHGLKPEELTIDDEVINILINEYTREAGLRDLERMLANIMRKALRKIQQHNQNNPDEPPMQINVNSGNIHDFAGNPKYSDRTSPAAVAGVTAGLAWTEMGGDIINVEAVTMPGTGKLTITGQLGDVLHESAKTALSFIRANASLYGIQDQFFKENDIHIHVPEGAIPKDGPSAGITMCVSILSAITKWPIKSDIAMTGELTLRGDILAIGGLKEKSLAAHRGKYIRSIIIPAQNEKDIPDLPDEVKAIIDIKICKNIHEVIKLSINNNYLGEPVSSVYLGN